MSKNANRDQRAPKEPAAVAYRDCVVTFIDILGFRSIVSKQSPEDIHKIVELVQRYARSGDEDFVKEYGLDADDTPWTRSIFFSDSVVRIRAYDSTYRDGSLFYELLDMVHAQSELIYRGIFIRGGLTIGKVYYQDNVLFGPAIIQAYEFESKFANYPRIIVDPAALAALKIDKRLRRDGHTIEEESGYIRDLIRRGMDGLYYIDFLGAWRGEMDNYEAFPDFLAEVKKHIVANATAAKDNLGVLQKYLWSARYLNVTAARHEDCKDEKRILIDAREIPALAKI